MKIGIALSLWRAANGRQSQADTATRIGVSLSAYRRFEAGQTIAHDDFMAILNWMLAP